MFPSIFVFTKHKKLQQQSARGRFAKLVGRRQDRLVNTVSKAIVVFIDVRQASDNSKTPTRYSIP
jgi:hypothetical protein